MNVMNWMDGAYGVPTWMWLTAVAAGSLLTIFWLWAWMASTAHRERIERRRVYYLCRQEAEEEE